MKRECIFGTRNQLANVYNRFQGPYNRVLFLCSAGLLRSATAAHVFSEAPYDWNTRTAGVALEYALNPVTEALMTWAHEIYVMEEEHVDILREIFQDQFDVYEEDIKVLNVPDRFDYRNPELVKLLKEKMNEIHPEYNQV